MTDGCALYAMMRRDQEYGKYFFKIGSKSLNEIRKIVQSHSFFHVLSFGKMNLVISCLTLALHLILCHDYIFYAFKFVVDIYMGSLLRLSRAPF